MEPDHIRALITLSFWVAVFLYVRSKFKKSASKNVAPSDQPKKSANGNLRENIQTIRFQYVDAEGNETERTVDLLSGKRGDKFTAFCHLRNEQRTFYFDRIIGFEVLDVATGEIMTPMEWRLKLQGTKKAQAALEKEQRLMATSC